MIILRENGVHNALTFFKLIILVSAVKTLSNDDLKLQIPTSSSTLC